MDMNVSFNGAPLVSDKPNTLADQKIQSQSGFAGIAETSTKQIARAVGQAGQASDIASRKQGGLMVDARTRRVYYQVKDPVTGEVEKFPSESDLQMAASIKQSIQQDSEIGKEEINLPPPGEFLDAKA